MKALIIDDEKRSCETIEAMLKVYCPQLTRILSANDIADGLKGIEQEKPTVVFLDINLKSGSGFDLLEQLSYRTFKLIFITAYNEHAIRAFKYSAIDYLLKPVDPQELTDAVNRALQNLKNDQLELRLENLKAYQTDLNNAKKIVLKTADNLFIVQLSSIIYLMADGAYTTFYLNNGNKILVSTHLKEYDDLFTGLHFFRPHQSYLINTQHLIRFDKKEGGHLIMSNNSTIPVSSRKKEAIYALFNQLNEF